MSWKQFGPILVPLLVAVVLARRMIKATRARKIRFARLWILPAVLVVIVLATLAATPTPGLLALGGCFAAACCGGAVGWFRVHTREFSVDPKSGAIASRSTPLGVIVIVGLLGVRYELKYLMLGQAAGTSLVAWTDGFLIFSAALLVAQSAHTWRRAKALLPPSREEASAISRIKE